MEGLHVSPYSGRADWPRCAFCGAAPVVLSARRDGAFRDAVFCADCGARVRAGDPAVMSKVPER